MKSNRIIKVSMGLMVLYSLVFVTSLNFYRAMICGIFYSGISLITLIISYTLLSREIRDVLAGLSRTIDGITSDNHSVEFPELDDTLLSKLQNQVLRLSEILKSQRDGQMEQKEQITAIIADISHQLKTPLTNLNIYSELLQDSRGDKESREVCIDSLRNEVEKLNWLTDKLMKMSNLETGLVQINKRQQPLEKAVLQAVDSLYLKAEKRNISISIDGDTGLLCSYDLRWIGESVFNMLDNAVKYSTPGSRLSIHIGSFKLFCFISITDSAPIIEQNEINRIFRRFYRGENSSAEEGAGLGLYISRNIVEKHGGFIRVKSCSEGNIFSINLPLEDRFTSGKS